MSTPVVNTIVVTKEVLLKVECVGITQYFDLLCVCSLRTSMLSSKYKDEDKF